MSSNWDGLEARQYSDTSCMANSDGWYAETERLQRSRYNGIESQDSSIVHQERSEKLVFERLSNYWKKFETIYCTDEKFRRIEPGTFPLVDGVSKRVAKLRAIGNSIVPEVAAEFIKCVMEARP